MTTRKWPPPGGGGQRFAGHVVAAGYKPEDNPQRSARHDYSRTRYRESQIIDGVFRLHFQIVHPFSELGHVMPVFVKLGAHIILETFLMFSEVLDHGIYFSNSVSNFCDIATNIGEVVPNVGGVRVFQFVFGSGGMVSCLFAVSCGKKSEHCGDGGKYTINRDAFNEIH